MRIKFVFDEKLNEDEVVVNVSPLNNNLDFLRSQLLSRDKPSLDFTKDDQQFFIELDEIIFFESYDDSIQAHTIDNHFQVKTRLYELETTLPLNFIRISKSTIANAKYIYSIERKINSSSLIKFKGTHKEVYVSRHYYQQLNNRIKEIK